MKLISFTNTKQQHRLGAVLANNSVIDLALEEQQAGLACSGYFNNMLSLIEAGATGLALAKRLLHSPSTLVKSYRLQAPLSKPPQIRDAMCFEKHIKQSLRSICQLRALANDQDPELALKLAASNGELKVPKIWYQQPVYYKANRFAVSGSGEEIKWPSYSKIMDYECELACIIGKKGKNISAEQATPYIFGYTIFNDFSARDAQSDEIQGFLGPAKGKDFDKANAMGPCIITADEFNPHDAHPMIVRVNGEQRSVGCSSEMNWSFEQLIQHISQDETLYPGEILGSGTVGNGCGLELMRFLNDGDCIELEIPAIGTLTNTVIR